MIRLLMAGLLLVSVTAVADTEVTHTFKDGEIIKAEEFNENFDDLEAAIEAIPADAIKAVTSADLDMDGNRVLFSNVYSQLADLPSAAGNHGMFAHVHETGEAYYAHAGNWIQLAKQSSIGGGSATTLSALTCTTDQIIKYDGSEWVCADMPSANTGGDGAAYGSPVWVDSSGTVLTGRDGRNVIWRVNGELRDIGEVWDDIFVRRVQIYYYSSNCSGDIAGYEADSGGDLWITNGVLHEEGALLENSPLYNSVDRGPQGCSSESGDTEGKVHQESSIGVAAPSWATEGTQMLEDLR